jgi:hypothetical protein
LRLFVDITVPCGGGGGGPPSQVNVWKIGLREDAEKQLWALRAINPKA